MAIVKFMFEISKNPNKIEMWACKNALMDLFPERFWGFESESNKFWFKEEPEHVDVAQERLLGLYRSYLDSRFILNCTSKERFRVAKATLLKNKIFFEQLNNELRLMVAPGRLSKDKIVELIKEAVRDSEEVTI